MDILGMLLAGLIVGALARLFVPGTTGLGCLPTIAIGIGGAVLGGLLGRELVGGVNQGDLVWLLFSVLGAVLILLLLQAVAGRRRR